MGSKRITREELKRLKRKRQRHLNAVLTLSVSAAMIVVLAVSVIVFNDRPSDAEYGAQMHVGVKNDFGTGDLPVMATPIDASAASSEEGTTTEETTQTETTEDESGFEVPETALPPVEEVAGNDWYPKGYEKVENVAPLSYFDDTVLIGDSRTEGIVLYSGLSNLNAFCYKGLNVSKLDSEACITLPEYGGKYTCYQAIEYTSFDNYYCMFGINELGWYNMDVFVEDFGDLVDHIKSVNPDATIYVESVMPVCKSRETGGDSVFTKENVDEVNSLLLAMCKKRKDCIYLDVGAAVQDEDGYLPEEGSPDGIHCNADYCKRVLQYIRCNRYQKK